MATPPLTPVLALNLQQEMQARNNGRAMAALHLEMVSQRQSIEASGQLHPATVLNFNPIPLRIEGNIDMTVPPCNDPIRQANQRLAIEFNGRVHQASYVTIRTPRFWPKTTGTTRDSQSDEDIAQHAINYLLPIGIGHQFWIHYNTGANDSNNMGGVLVFQGDRHAIEPEKLAKLGGTILVPTRTKLKNGSHAYGTQAKELKTVLTELFTAQRIYVDRQLQEAQSLYDGAPDERKNIHQTHRTWGQYAVDMGWRAKPPIWMTERLGEDVEQVKCVYCQATSERQDAHFCSSCNAPYDAYRTFMAGLVVPPAYLQVLKGEERAAVLAEIKLRREGFGEDEEQPTPKKKVRE
jgi:hypothetical protein